MEDEPSLMKDLLRGRHAIRPGPSLSDFWERQIPAALDGEPDAALDGSPLARAQAVALRDTSPSSPLAVYSPHGVQM